nr:hypothetical protein GCM10020092_060170 [Actinoplanes digitatis]
MPAVQLAQAFAGGRHLEAADRVEAAEFGELVDGVAGERGHGPRRVGLEHQARRVRAGAAGGEERALFEHGDVPAAALGELVGEGAADDPGPDDDDRHALAPFAE